MKLLILTTSILLSICTTSFGQTDNPYKELDSLINTNSMIDAMTVIEELKENHQKDTLNSDYWIRYSKASNILYESDDAKSSINKAIKLSPNKAVCYYEKGILLNSLGELEPALSALEKATSINPTGEYFYWKGIVNHQLNNIVNAERDYTNAIENKFESPELYNNLSILLAENSKFEKALEMVNKAILLDGEYADLYSARARINCFLLNIDAACRDNETAKRMGNYNVIGIPDSVCKGTTLQKLEFGAGFLIISKSYERGAAAYSKLIESYTLKSDYFLTRGYCYYRLKDFEKAEKDYLKALTLPNPNLDLIYTNLGLLNYDTNDFQKSIMYCSKRIELNPTDNVPYIDRGNCYRNLKKYKEAEKDLNKSIALNPDFFRAFGSRSFLFLELGQYQKAFEDASKSIELNPEYGYGYVVLAQAKQQLGHRDFCEDWYNAKKYGALDADAGIEENCK